MRARCSLSDKHKSTVIFTVESGEVACAHALVLRNEVEGGETSAVILTGIGLTRAGRQS